MDQAGEKADRETVEQIGMCFAINLFRGFQSALLSFVTASWS